MTKKYLYNFWKQPYEIFRISMDFSQNMETGETIILGNSSVSAVLDSDGSTDKTSDVLEASTLAVLDDTKLTVIVKGGLDLIKYGITFRAEISATKKLEVDIGMLVRD